jgi:hypothetical protein
MRLPSRRAASSLRQAEPTKGVNFGAISFSAASVSF